VRPKVKETFKSTTIPQIASSSSLATAQNLLKFAFKEQRAVQVIHVNLKKSGNVGFVYFCGIQIDRGIQHIVCNALGNVLQR